MKQAYQAFDNYINEQEVFSLRCERFYDDVDVVRTSALKTSSQKYELMLKWVEAAFHEGFKQGAKEL